MGHLFHGISVRSIDFPVDALQIDVLKRKETSFSENHSQCKHDRHFYWRAVHVVGKPLAGHHPIAAETQQCR